MLVEEYNGWTNVFTWLVMLWVNNNEVLQATAREAAQADGADGLEALINDLADNAVESACLWADLLGHALGQVNWQECAKSLLDE